MATTNNTKQNTSTISDGRNTYPLSTPTTSQPCYIPAGSLATFNASFLTGMMIVICAGSNVQFTYTDGSQRTIANKSSKSDYIVVTNIPNISTIYVTPLRYNSHDVTNHDSTLENFSYSDSDVTFTYTDLVIMFVILCVIIYLFVNKNQ